MASIESASSTSADALQARKAPVISDVTALASMSDEDLYNTFFLPMLKRVSNDNALVRDELFRDGGPTLWAHNRCRGFAHRARDPTQNCRPLEQSIRGAETRIALELCYREATDEGLEHIMRHSASLAQQARLAELRHPRTARRFTPRLYQYPVRYACIATSREL